MSATAASSSFYARLRARTGTPEGVLCLAFVTWTVAAMDQSLFGYAVPGVMREFGIGIDVVGLMISASFVFGMLAPPAGGVLADTFGTRRVLATCLGIACLLVYAQSLATSVLALGAFRVASYGFSAALSPITSALVANTAPPRRRSLYVAILQCAYPFGWFIAAMTFVPDSAAANWRSPFAVALWVVPVAVAMYLLLPDDAPRSAQRAHRSPVGELFARENRSTALLCALAFFLYGGAIGGSAFYLPTFFQEQRGYAPGDASLIVGVTYAIAMLGYLGAALLSQTAFGSRRTTLVWSGLGGLLFGASVWLPPNFARDVAAFGFTATFFFGTSSILTTYLLETFDARIRATAAAICGSAALTAGFIVFPLLTARAVQVWGWQWAFTGVVVTAALAVTLVVALLPEASRRAPLASET